MGFYNPAGFYYSALAGIISLLKSFSKKHLVVFFFIYVCALIAANYKK